MTTNIFFILGFVPLAVPIGIIALCYGEIYGNYPMQRKMAILQIILFCIQMLSLITYICLIITN